MEIWKPIKGYEGLYEVSNLGSVKSLARKTTSGKHRVCHQTKCGYISVGLWKNGAKKQFLVHRLVADAFIPNPNNKPQVNHIDENKSNNRVDNLEWCTNLENHRHGTINKRLSNILKNNPKTSKPVNCYTKNKCFVCLYPSISEAERKTGIFNQSIVQCCKGKLKTAGGFIWEYAT